MWTLISFPPRACAAAAVLLLAGGCAAPPPPAAPSSPAAQSQPPTEPAHGHAHGHGHAHSHGDGHGHAHGHDHGHGHDHSGPLVRRFERAEEWAPRFDDPARDAWQKPADVIAAMKITPGMTVADIGAGTGYFLPHLARAVGPTGSVLGLDLEPDMVRYMTERAAREGLANVRARQVPPDDPQIPARSVDRILIVDTWHHIPARERYAPALAVALRPGGAVFVVDFTPDTRRGPPPEHRIPAEQVAAELRAAGLDAEILAEELPDQYIVVGRKP